MTTSLAFPRWERMLPTTSTGRFSINNLESTGIQEEVWIVGNWPLCMSLEDKWPTVDRETHAAFKRAKSYKKNWVVSVWNTPHLAFLHQMFRHGNRVRDFSKNGTWIKEYNEKINSKANFIIPLNICKKLQPSTNRNDFSKSWHKVKKPRWRILTNRFHGNPILSYFKKKEAWFIGGYEIRWKMQAKGYLHANFTAIPVWIMDK